MDDLVNAGVSVGFTLCNVVGDLIDSVTLDIVVGFTLGDVAGVIYGVGAGVESTLGNEDKIKFYEMMMVEPWWW